MCLCYVLDTVWGIVSGQWGPTVFESILYGQTGIFIKRQTKSNTIV